MDIELRLTSLDLLADALATDAEAVGLGQEGCPHRLPEPSAIRRAADTVRAAGRAVTLVLPQAWERFAEQLIDLAAAVAADGAVTLVVNDFGTLVALRERPVPSSTRLAIGQALVFGYAQASLADHWLAGEPADLQSALRGANVADDATARVLTSLGVREAETDTATAAATGRAAFADRGLALRVVTGPALVGIARACPTARHYGVEPGHCDRVCDRGSFRLSTTHRWRLADGHREPMTRDARNLAGNLCVSGNLVYRPVPDAPADADVLVVDARWLGSSTPAEAVAAARSGGRRAAVDSPTR